MCWCGRSVLFDCATFSRENSPCTGTSKRLKNACARRRAQKAGAQSAAATNRADRDDVKIAGVPTQSAVLDRIETVACAIEFLVRLIDEDMKSPDDALDAACALAELFEPNAIVVYTTIDSRSRV